MILDNFNSDNFNDNDVLSVKDKTYKISKIKKAIQNTFEYLSIKLCENLHSQDIKIDLAVEANADFITTYNQKDLQAASLFGIKVVTLNEFLQQVGEIQ